MSNKTQLQTNNASLDGYISRIQAAKEVAATLPEAGGVVELPDLTNEGSTSDLLSGKELIDQEGKIITGSMSNNGTITSTMDGINIKSVSIPEGYTSGGTVSLDNTIDNEVNDQADLIAQIKSIVDNLPEAGSGSVEIPEGYIIPSGTLDITENGDHDVTEYASVNVAVPTGGGSATDLRLANLVADTLIELDDDTVVTARAYAFYNVKNLQRVKLSNLTSTGSYLFSGCESLISADLPNLSSSTGTYCFNGCENLTQVNLPKISAVSNYTFSDCTALEKVELGQITSLGSYSFRRGGISTLIIRNTTTVITKLNSTNAFSETPIANGEGYIYFYREYVEKYKAATNWTTYANQIRAIEDYPEICG